MWRLLLTRLSHMARHLVRPPVAKDRVAETGDGRVVLRIPADPGTGEEVLFPDPLEWIHEGTLFHSVACQVPSVGFAGTPPEDSLDPRAADEDAT